MKIANVIYSLDRGGAAIAVERINKTLNTHKNISKIITYQNIKDKKKNSFFLKKYLKLFFNKLLKKFLFYFFNLKFNNTVNFNLFNSKLLNEINKSKFTIINLHWLGNDTLSIEDVGKIRKKTIITLHDMWPYTSVEHYTDIKSFNKFYSIKSKYKRNFILNYIFNLKIKNFKNISHVICTSEWQKKMADNSLVFKHAKKTIIPLPLNFSLWKPVNKKTAKKKLSIAINIFTIFLPLADKYASKRKGLNLMIKTLEKIDNIKICLITTNYGNIIFQNKRITHKNYNNVNSRQKLIELYSASDLFAMPSVYESFGQTLLEAQACNCPAIVFNNTGCADLISHKINGYKTNYLDLNDFKEGVLWSVKNKNKKKFSSIRSNAKKKFSEKVICDKYKKFYSSIN
jgi:glycosyltransferase involved in cell wall biosynthesis